MAFVRGPATAAVTIGGQCRDPVLEPGHLDRDRGLHGRVALTFSGGGLLVASNAAGAARREATIREQGIAGVATILRMRDTGITVNDDPRVAFGLAIELPGQPRYELDTTLQVGRLRVGRLGIGRSFPCSVLPGERDAIIIGWDTDATVGGRGSESAEP